VLLGDLMARFADESVAADALLRLDDLALVAEASRQAASEQLSLGEFSVRSIAQFAAGATDADWVTLMGLMARSDDPGQTFLRIALARAIGDRQQTDA